MSPVSANTRRRAFQATPPLDTHSLPLRKSGTFHSPTTISSDIVDPLEDIAFLPRRSPTNPHHLEELIGDIRGVGAALDCFDYGSAGKNRESVDAGILNDTEVHPLPAFVVDNIEQNHGLLELQKKFGDDDSLDYDSGLGSSVGGSNSDSSTTRSSVHSAITSDSAITRSFSTIDSLNNPFGHILSEHAAKQIQRLIIKPILREKSLKEFHPLIKDVPRRIGAKNISNLRDLEKTLLFLAPEYSASPSSYLSFCQASIRCLHTTVDHISDQDQRLPTDRPYTNNYFVDLVEQIHRYAQIIAEAREKEAEGEKLDEMDYSPNEKLAVKGGLSRDGKPMELVREKDGKVLPITEEGSSSSDMVVAGKRAFTEEDYEDDDGISRSMARRRKSEIPGDVIHICRDCKKEFKRPCDLTKHEKTHSRPWKCPATTCKFHELGWPTEKECDRHFNDKHSSAPHQYRCHYEGCSYSSKRDSNCKQHMEKSHGWTYVRSKNNGRKRGSDAAQSQVPSTPVTPLLDAPSSSAAQAFRTPMTPFATSPAVAAYPEFPDTMGFTPAFGHIGYDGDRRGSAHTVETSATGMTFSSSQSPFQPTTSFEGAITPEDPPMNFGGNLQHFDERSMSKASSGATYTNEGVVDFNAPIVDTSFGGQSFPQHHPHLSPGGQGDAMLYSPTLQHPANDDGHDLPFDSFNADFELFGSEPLPSSLDVFAPADPMMQMDSYSNDNEILGFGHINGNNSFEGSSS